MRRRASEQIAAHLLSLPQLRTARLLALYLSLPEEVSTAPLIAGLRPKPAAPRLVAPVVQPGRRLAFYPLPADPAALRLGPYGILQPPTDGLSPVSPDSLDVVLLPGVAFDPAGHRLGYGAGYYDRYLAPLRKQEAGDVPRLPASPEMRTQRPLLIGLAFSVQILPALPSEPHDVEVDMVATEEGIRRSLRV